MDMEFEAIYVNIQPKKRNTAELQSQSHSNMDVEFEDNYANIQPKNRNAAGLQSQNRDKTQNSKRSRRFGVFAAFLGLICVLLVVALILLYIHLTAERAQMNMRYMDISEEYNKSLSSLTDEKDKLQKKLTSMIQNKQKLETRVKNLSVALMKNQSDLCRYYKSIEQFCRDLGGDLLNINTEEEQNIMNWNDFPCSEKRRWICEMNKT